MENSSASLRTRDQVKFNNPSPKPPPRSGCISLPCPQEPSAGGSLNYNTSNLTATRRQGPQFPKGEKTGKDTIARFSPPGTSPGEHCKPEELQTRSEAEQRSTPRDVGKFCSGFTSRSQISLPYPISPEAECPMGPALVTSSLSRIRTWPKEPQVCPERPVSSGESVHRRAPLSSLPEPGAWTGGFLSSLPPRGWSSRAWEERQFCSLVRPAEHEDS